MLVLMNRTPFHLLTAIFSLALISCQPMPPLAARFSIEDQANTLSIHLKAPPSLQVQYLRNLDWDIVYGTLNGPGITPKISSARMRFDQASAQRIATLKFPLVPPGVGYALTLRFMREDSYQSPELIASNVYSDLELVPDTNALTLDLPLDLNVTRNIPQAAVFDAYVSTIPDFGTTGGVTNCRDARTDMEGRTFILDNSQLRRIARDANGNLSISTLAGRDASLGEGYVDGPGQVARFQNPMALCIGRDRAIYIADTGNNCIRKVLLDLKGNATVSTVAGGPAPGFVDGDGTIARFNGPEGITIAQDGTLYVSDTGNQRIRRIVIDSDGNVTVKTLAGDGTAGFVDGPATAAHFFNPKGIDIDSTGTIYVADYSNRRVRALERDINGIVQVETVAGNGTSGTADGPAETAQLTLPTSLQVDDRNNVYVLTGRALRKIEFNEHGDATVSSIAGMGGIANADCSAAQLKLSDPRGIVLQPSGDILIIERGIIRRLHIEESGALTASRFLGSYSTTLDGTGGDGPLLDYLAYEPNNLAVDSEGNILITTLNRNQILRLKSASMNTVPTIIAGTGTAGFRDGPGDEAQFNLLQEIELGPDGAFYAADYFNECIRRISIEDSGSATVSTVAGTPGVSGFLDGDVNSARFYRPAGVVFDGKGNLYVSENYNHTIRRISFTTTGPKSVSLVAGQARVPGFADGPGIAAKFKYPMGLAFDKARNALLVADSGNRAIRQITFDPSGEAYVSTLAGGTLGTADGPASVAGFSSPRDVLVDEAGNIYIADVLKLRKLTFDDHGQAYVRTVAGSDAGFIDGAALNARFGDGNGGGIVGLAFAPDGNIYMADSGNHVIRMLTIR